jgi:hypothetical protein
MTGHSGTVARLCHSLEVDMAPTIDVFGWTPVASPVAGLEAMAREAAP